MARIEDLSDPAHRRLAQKHIPPKVLARLSRAELLYRVKHAKHLHDTAAEHPVPESALAIHEHARKILASDPVADYLAECGRRNALLQGAPSHLWWEYHAMLREYQEAHEFPPGLTGAVNLMLLGKPVVGDPELSAVVEASINHAGVRP